MFLDFFGKLCFSHVRPPFFYAILLIPFLCSGGYLLNRHAYLEGLASQFLETARKGKSALERKTRKERFIMRYSKADPYFLDKQIEALSFLQKEQGAIESMVHHPALSNKKTLQERLEFLKSKENRLSFVEENIRTSPKVKETEEKQRHPVQMDETDLQKLLALIEDIPIGLNAPQPNMPQLLVRDIKIKKTENPLHSEVYEVEMELLKREWIDP